MASQTHHGHTRRTAKTRLGVEWLEPRLLLSASTVEPLLEELVGPLAFAAAENAVAAPSDYVPIPGDTVETGTRVRVFDLFGGTWADAEKDATSDEDDNLCWAATLSNLLEYTGWGFVGGMTNADQILDYYEQHWKDVGETVEPAFKWFFDGVGNANVDVAGGGFYPHLNYSDYFSLEDNDANVMSFVDTHIRAGSPVGLWVLNGFNHEITCWGFNYDDTKVPGATDYYLGVWITDSDDNKGAANGYAAPNNLHYYNVVWDSDDGWWEMPDYGGADLHINQTVAIQRANGPVLAINGDQDQTGQNDAINIALDATGTWLRITLNGTQIEDILASSVHELNIKGWGGNDTLTIDFTNGDPLANLALNFDGGAGGDDALAITGGTGKIGSYRPGTTLGDGVVQVGGSTITFTGLEPVTVSGFAEFTFTTPNSNDVITIDSPAAGQNRISGTSGGVAFESLTFSNVAHFLLDTATNDGPLANPNDTVTFTSDLVATALASFTVDLGPGNDTANASSVTALGVTLLGGTGDDTLTGGAGNDHIEGGDGHDTLATGPGVLEAVDGGAGQDLLILDTTQTTVTFHDYVGYLQVNYGANSLLGLDIETAEVLARTNATTVRVEDLANTDLRTLMVDFRGTGNSLVVEGSDIADTIGADLDPFTGWPTVTTRWGEVTVVGASVADGDRLTIEGRDGDDVIHVNPTVQAGPQSLLVTLNGGDGNDHLSAGGQLNGQAGNDTLVGGAGNDTMDGGEGDDTFIGNAGTDAIGGGASNSVGDTILVEGTSGNDTISVALDGSGFLVVTVNGLTTTYTNFIGGPIASSGIELIKVNGLAGNDTLTIDNTNGVLPSTLAVAYDGGDGDDALTLTGTTTVGAHYRPGPLVNEGTLTHVGVAATMNLTFTNIEPVTDLTPGDLFVYGTDADNAISYSQGSDATRGKVTVDGFESIQFSNKTTLAIAGGAGSDTLHLNNPNTPTGLTSILYNGQDPTASDTVTINGTTAQNAIVVDQLTPDGARITGAQPVPVTVSGAEHLTINGQGGDDSLTVTTPAGLHMIFLDDDGPLGDTGVIRIRESVSLGGKTLLGLNFLNLGSSSTLTFADASGTRTDTLIITARPGDVSEVFDVGSTGVIEFSQQPALQAPVQLPGISTPGVLYLDLVGQGGDDRFYVFAGNPFARIFVDGGDPSASDELVLVNTSDDEAFGLSLGFSPQITGFAAGPILWMGIEHVRFAGALIVGTAGTDTLSVTDATGHFTYTPQDAASGEFQIADTNTRFSFTEVLGAFSLDLAGTDDTLTVVGSPNSDVWNIGTSQIELTGRKAINVTGAEAIAVRAQDGSDVFNVTPGAVPINILGGPPSGQVQQPLGDMLNLVTGGASFTYFVGPELDAGWFLVAGTEAVSFDEIEQLRIDGLLFILPDALEPNDSIATATVLGSLPKITLRDLTLHPLGGSLIDQDYFQITAQDTGKLILNAFFDDDLGLGLGDVNLEVRDASGDLIALANSLDDNELIVIPVVGQQRYYLHVFSANNLPNTYALEIENFAAPLVDAVILDPMSDTGASHSDNVTSLATPRIFLEADLSDFNFEGINILDPGEVAANLPGAAVQVFVNNVAVGYATAVAGTDFTLFEYTLPPGQLSTTFVPAPGGAGLNFIKGAVRIFDGQTPQATGRTQLSGPLQLTYDPAAPTGSVPDLLAASDTGFDSTDNVTYIATPAFQGTGEPNAKVFIYAETVGTGIVELIGQGVVGTNGAWEVTVEPLDHDFPVAEYRISAVYEDLAGNRSAAPVLGAGLQMWHDSTPPNVPYLDLITEDDKGFSHFDNYTQELTLHFDVTVNDTANNGNPFPNEVQWFIQDRYENNPGEVTVASSGGFSTAGFWDDVSVTFTDYGVHNLKLVAWDRAGHRSEYLLKVQIDEDACDESVLKLANGQVILYDRDAVMLEDSNGFEIVTDVDASDFKIRVDKYNNVTRVDLVGNPTGLGMIINPANGGPVEFRDARKPPPNRWSIETLEFLFINSSSPRVLIRSGINGEDLSDILKAEAGLVPDPDLDGDGLTDDLTAFYSAGPVKSFNIKDAFGDVSGDIVIKGADPFGFAVQSFDVRRVNFVAGIDVVLPDGAINKFNQGNAEFAADFQVRNIVKGIFNGTLTGPITFLDDFTGVVATGGSTFGGDVTVLGDFLGTLGGKKTPNGPSTLYLTSGQTFNGLVSRVPDGLAPVFGEDLFFGGAFAAIDVV